MKHTLRLATTILLGTAVAALFLLGRTSIGLSEGESAVRGIFSVTRLSAVRWTFAAGPLRAGLNLATLESFGSHLSDVYGWMRDLLPGVFRLSLGALL